MSNRYAVVMVQNDFGPYGTNTPQSILDPYIKYPIDATYGSDDTDWSDDVCERADSIRKMLESSENYGFKRMVHEQIGVSKYKVIVVIIEEIMSF